MQSPEVEIGLKVPSSEGKSKNGKEEMFLHSLDLSIDCMVALNQNFDKMQSKIKDLKREKQSKRRELDQIEDEMRVKDELLAEERKQFDVYCEEKRKRREKAHQMIVEMKEEVTICYRDSLKNIGETLEEVDLFRKQVGTSKERLTAIVEELFEGLDEKGEKKEGEAMMLRSENEPLEMLFRRNTCSSISFFQQLNEELDAEDGEIEEDGESHSPSHPSHLQPLQDESPHSRDALLKECAPVLSKLVPLNEPRAGVKSVRDKEAKRVNLELIIRKLKKDNKRMTEAEAEAKAKNPEKEKIKGIKMRHPLPASHFLPHPNPHFQPFERIAPSADSAPRSRRFADNSKKPVKKQKVA